MEVLWCHALISVKDGEGQEEIEVLFSTTSRHLENDM